MSPDNGVELFAKHEAAKVDGSNPAISNVCEDEETR
jgi:hypothetical protein